MASFVDILAAAKTVESEVVAGHLAHALKASAVVIDGVADTLLAVGVQGGPEEQLAKDDCCRCIQNCIDECNKHCVNAAETGVEAGVTGLSNGKLWGALKQLLLTILPLLIT